MRRVAYLRILLLVGLVVLWVFAAKQKPTPQQSQAPTEGQDLPKFEELTTPFAVFYTKAEIPNKTNTVVQFPYYFSTPHQPFFLTLPTEPGEKSLTVLVDHPIVAVIKDWPKILNERLVLYQKEMTYNSIDDFISAKPVGSVADPALVFNNVVTAGSWVMPLNEWSEGKDFRYFLTTYHEPKLNAHYNLFETRIDASKGLLQACEKGNTSGCVPNLMWKLDMPTVNKENKLYLGEVHVDFRQSNL